MTLSDYTREYVEHNDGSRGYLEQILYCIVAIEQFIGREVEIQELTLESINSFIRHERGRPSRICCLTK